MQPPILSFIENEPLPIGEDGHPPDTAGGYFFSALNDLKQLRQSQESGTLGHVLGHIRLDQLHLCFFQYGNQHLNMQRASRESVRAFFESCGVQGNYEVNPLDTDLSRHAATNLLLARGQILIRKGWNTLDEVYILVPVQQAIHTNPWLSCEKLSRQNRWDTTLCCIECHQDQEMLVEHFLANGEVAHVCCRAANLIDHWLMHHYPPNLKELFPHE